MSELKKDFTQKLKKNPRGTGTPKIPEAPEQKTSNVHPNSIANLRPRPTGRTEKKYIQLDIIGYEDYLNVMAQRATELEKKRIKELNKTLPKEERQKAGVITRTRYIQELIRKDFEEHKAEYELLSQLNKLNS